VRINVTPNAETVMDSHDDAPDRLMAQARELREELAEEQRESEAKWDRVERGFDDVVWQRLEDQLAWYDIKASHSRAWHMRLSLLTTLSAVATIAFLGLDAPKWLGMTSALLVVLSQALQQLYQFQQNWVSYRATAEALKKEKYLYLALAGPYESATEPRRLLIERIQSIVSADE
jgi:hypothetical protein